MPEIDALLFRGESESLDFKRDQYRFQNSTDHEKSELLKDILAMANSWRDETAYIIIGVLEEDDGNKVVEISEHLDEAALQQFVNEKTNKDIKFTYDKLTLQGKKIGAIKIPIQERPFYLKKDYGKLHKEAVYIRRGSSTKKALPEEIMKMGETYSSLKESEILVEFVNNKSRATIGKEINLNGEYFAIEGNSEIPNYNPPNTSRYNLPSLHRQTNSDYYRDVFKYIQCNQLMRKVALSAKNLGKISIHNTRIELSLSDPNQDFVFMETHDFKEELPEKTTDFIHSSVGRINTIAELSRPSCDIDYTDGTWHLLFDFKDLQPQRRLMPGLEFYIGFKESNTISIKGTVVADELPEGATCELTISCATKKNEITLESFLENMP